jgi:aryl carrier-like protein
MTALEKHHFHHITTVIERLSMTMRHRSSLGESDSPHREQERLIHGLDVLQAMDYVRRFTEEGNAVDQTVDY